MVCTTVPAWADVNITVAQVPDTNEVIISFDATSETNLVRAFAFDIRLDNDANIVSVVGLSSGYWVYPGSIQITADGTITDIGSIGADYADLPGDTLPGTPDGNGVTLEAASLYAPVGPGSPNAPAKSGDLASIIVSGSTCITISANVPRAGPTGVIMENPDEIVTVNYPSPCVFIDVNFPPDECYMETGPGYETWALCDKPDCWCYCHHCRGDADGCESFGRPVGLSDLNCVKSCFGRTINEIYPFNCNCICCDFDHQTTFGRPVALSDLNILKANFGEIFLECCPMTHLNYYEEGCN
jgi:hypothetical protein